MIPGDDRSVHQFRQEVCELRASVLHLVKTAEADEQTRQAWRALGDRYTFTIRLIDETYGDLNQHLLF